MILRIFRTPGFRSFFAEFMMIVVGVLAALALEQVAQSLLHANAAKATMAALDVEIRSNVGLMRRLRAVHAERAASISALSGALLRDIKAGVPDEEAIENFQRAQAGGAYFGSNVNTPLFLSHAWEIALADQSASWMEPAEQRRYAAVYAMHRTMTEHVRAKMSHVLDGPGLVDAESELQMGASDARALYRATRQVLAALAMVESNMRSTEESTVKLFPALATVDSAVRSSAVPP